MDDFRIPDNDRNQVFDEPIVPDGPASVSNTAGTFVCNHVIYGVCHMIASKYPGKRSGFIHIPYLPQQVIDKPQMPSMSIENLVLGLTAAIEKI